MFANDFLSVGVRSLMILHYTNYFPKWRSKGKRGNIFDRTANRRIHVENV